MTRNNPFSGRGAPVSGDRLVGRKALIDRLISRVHEEAHCSIVGLPRMGKTSVAMEVMRRIPTRSHDMTSGYITLDAIRGPVQAYSRIIEETMPEQSEDQPKICTSNHDEAYDAFRRILRRRKRAGIRSLIVIDEVDAVVREDFIDASLFISRIREIANERDKYGLTFIFVSRRSLDMIQGEVDCSTLAGLCEVIYLQPLDLKGLDDLCDRSTIPVDPSGREALWDITGGQPFLAEVVMCEAVEQPVTILNNRAIETAQHAQSHEFTNHYRHLEDLLGKDMFDSLCELTVGPSWRPIPPHTVSLLKHYGILRSSNESSGNPECMSNHLRDYLTLVTRTRPSWTLLEETERELRYFVNERMLEAYGENWFDTLFQKHPDKQCSLQKMTELRAKEKKLFGDAASDFILDYAYIGDLKDLIFAEWDKFRLTLGGTKAEWERRFYDIIRFRNPAAHFRPIPADVLQEAERSCKVVLSKLHSIATC